MTVLTEVTVVYCFSDCSDCSNFYNYNVLLSLVEPGDCYPASTVLTLQGRLPRWRLLPHGTDSPRHRCSGTDATTTRCILLTAHYTLHTLHYTHYTAHSTLHTLHHTLYTTHTTLHTPQCTLYKIHFILHTLHCTLYTAHSTLHTLHCTL